MIHTLLKIIKYLYKLHRLNEHVSDIIRIPACYKRGVGCLEESDNYQRVRLREYSNLNIVLNSSHTNLNNPRKTSMTVVIVSSRYKHVLSQLHS